MRKRFSDRWDRPDMERLSILLCLTACFTIGVIGGCLFAGLMGADSQAHLLAYFDHYFSMVKDEPVYPQLFSTVWELGRWPVLAFLMGFTALGVFGLPIVFLARGFLLSYSISVLVYLFGGPGILVAMSIFGLSSLLSLPALFVAGVDAQRSAGALAGALLGRAKAPSPFQKGHFVHACSCCALIAAGVFAQLWISPILLQAAAGLFV